MNKLNVKKFAMRARNKLLDGIRQKAYELGICEDGVKDKDVFQGCLKINDLKTSKVYSTHMEGQWRTLVEQVELRGFEQVVEEAAYTWFTLIVALRFMEVNEFLPTGVRVLSSRESGKTEPEIVREALNTGLDVDKRVIRELIEVNDTEGLFRYLFLKQCNQLRNIMPMVFKGVSGYLELLLPDSLLSRNSVIGDLINSIEEDDFKDNVEIIGWLYQYYISAEKDRVFSDLKKNKKVSKEDIPAATQLFTPKWIVRYMLENSLGRMWLMSHPDDELKSNWKYYIDEVKREVEAQIRLSELSKTSLSPEDIRLIDPACGCGHILVYAFDLLYDIYLKAKYSERDIPRLILEKNLYGLDIDHRAVRIAIFALMMKAGSRNKGVFNEAIKLNVCSIQESDDIPKESIKYIFSKEKGVSSTLSEDVEYLIDVFRGAREYGSIIRLKPVDFNRVESKIHEVMKGEKGELIEPNIKEILMEKIPKLIQQGRIMSGKYDVVCTNPPYLGIRNVNKKLASYIVSNYPHSKYDLFSTFVERCLDFCSDGAFLAAITMHSWMFLSSFEKFRKKVLSNELINLVHLGSKGFENDVGTIVRTASFVIRKTNVEDYTGTYVDLTPYANSMEKQVQFKNKDNYRQVKQSAFTGITGCPIAYWISEEMTKAFEMGTALGDIGETRQGMATSDNKKFVRLWHEVDYQKIAFDCRSAVEAQKTGAKWFPYNKGGKFIKWYGNNEYLVNWENDGLEVKRYARKLYGSPTRTVKSIDKYFSEAITWPYITDSSRFGVRYQPYGFIFDVAGSSLFVERRYRYYLMGLMCSKVCVEFMKVINPTMNFQSGDISKIPVIIDDHHRCEVEELTKENICISRQNWDYFENSWDFKSHPLLYFKNYKGVVTDLIEQSFYNWEEFANEQFEKLKANEEELNRIFIEVYGLQGELTSEVRDEEITIRTADRKRDVKSLISYAVGCMFGRYSLEEEGLIYAGGEFKKRFVVEDGMLMVNTKQGWKKSSIDVALDNVIPIVDGKYFEDDIVNRFLRFLKVTYGEKNLKANLNFVAESIGKKPKESSLQAIRRYFLKDFYNDHLKAYKKRPIYWLFDSGRRNGFKALVYLHRYSEYTLSKVRNNFLLELVKKYEEELSRLNRALESSLSKMERNAILKKKRHVVNRIEECLDYDRALVKVANNGVHIDLDEGIMANYKKFQGVEIFSEKRGSKEINLLK